MARLSVISLDQLCFIEIEMPARRHALQPVSSRNIVCMGS